MEVVNGYVCNNCSDVASAKKGVDPAHPKDGPNGAAKAEKAQDTDRGPAVVFGGQAQSPGQPQAANGVEAVRPSQYVPGSSVNLKA